MQEMLIDIVTKFLKYAQVVPFKHNLHQEQS